MIDIRPNEECYDIRLSKTQAKMLFDLFESIGGGFGNKLYIDNEFANGIYRDRLRIEVGEMYLDAFDEIFG